MNDKDSQYIIDKIHMILDEYNPIEKEGFLNLRALYNSENLQDKWIYLIVLASFSFNFMARFNSKHQYNSSYAKGICKYNTSIENNIINFSKLLKERNVDFYSPYGYISCVPKGEKLLLTQGGGEQVCIGVESDSSAVGYAEVKITSLSGAYIHLKNDGSIELNGLLISKEGKIIEQSK